MFRVCHRGSYTGNESSVQRFASAWRTVANPLLRSDTKFASARHFSPVAKRAVEQVWAPFFAKFATFARVPVDIANYQC
jgi:hypothetical protein